MKEEKQLYLQEDKDILDNLSTIGPMSTGTALGEQQKKISELQIKATLRTRKTMIDLDKTNTRFTLVIIFFTIVQMLIAGFQFILDLTSFPNKLFIGFLVVAFTVLVVLLTRLMDKRIAEEK